MPYEIADLSRVWVLADVYETDLRAREGGHAGHAHPQGLPEPDVHREGDLHRPDARPEDPHRQGAPRVPEPERRAQARDVRRGGAADASRARGCASPPTRSSTPAPRRWSSWPLGEGKFQPREVQLGDADGDRRRGGCRALTAGEQVVTRANFLIDSESRLRASLAADRREVADDQARSSASRPRTGSWSSPGRSWLLAVRVLDDAEHPARRPARPLRHPGHRLLALGPQPRHHRGPGHLSHHHGAARRARR